MTAPQRETVKLVTVPNTLAEYQQYCEVLKAEVLRLRAAQREAGEAEQARIVGILRGDDFRYLVGDGPEQPIRPTHGSCCTCQTCGRYHGDCVCSSNELWRAIRALPVEAPPDRLSASPQPGERKEEEQ